MHTVRMPPEPDRHDRPAPAEASDLAFALDGPLSVRSGHTARHRLLVTNHGDDEVTVVTNGQVTATVVDDVGRRVGGYAGAQLQPAVIFTVAPAQTASVPLLVGTASFRADPGDAIPPGHWHLQAMIDLMDGRRVLTPALDLTVTR